MARVDLRTTRAKVYGLIENDKLPGSVRQTLRQIHTDLEVAVVELRAVREAVEDVRSALAPGRWRGFGGPDGVSKDEVLADVAAALTRYDDKVVSDE